MKPARAPRNSALANEVATSSTRSSFTSQPAMPRQRSASHICQADPALMQEVIMGGAVVSAVGAALVNGIKNEPEMCQSCAGTGGIKCFACEGSGTMNRVSLDDMAVSSKKRDPLGRNIDKRECLACKGCGKLFCKKCSGSGYL